MWNVSLCENLRAPAPSSPGFNKICVGRFIYKSVLAADIYSHACTSAFRKMANLSVRVWEKYAWKKNSFRSHVLWRGKKNGKEGCTERPQAECKAEMIAGLQDGPDSKCHDRKNTEPGCLWGLCSEASLQLQWSRTSHTGSEGFNTYRQIHQKATQCHGPTSAHKHTHTHKHNFLLCCFQKTSLDCEIFTATKISEWFLCCEFLAWSEMVGP